VIEEPRRPSTRQLWSGLLALGATLLALLGGLVVRDSVLADTVPYEDPAAGLAVRRPAGWLLDAQGDYVFRLQDPAARPFKTALQVSVVTIGPDATGRNVLDSLTLKRSASLSGYRVLSVADPVPTLHGSAAEMRYAYVASEADPFLETLPVVVLGMDVVYLKGDQAIVATYLADVDQFEKQYFRFEQFLASLQF
jgi:hypothetical protein